MTKLEKLAKTKTGIKVSASAFMAVQIGALEFGGIGGERYFATNASKVNWPSEPVCAAGMLCWAAGETVGRFEPVGKPRVFPGFTTEDVNDSVLVRNNRVSPVQFLRRLEKMYGPIEWAA